MHLPIDDSHLIPLEEGHAVSRGWPPETGGRPHGVTWHWTATWNLQRCTELLGGAHAERKGAASAHVAVGRSRDEGIHRYVSLEDRSWHAGLNQTLCYDGRPCDRPAWKGARTTVGIEAVYIGYARDDVPRGHRWRRVHSPDGRQEMYVPPWPKEQIDMLVAYGKQVLQRWPHIEPQDHHGHHDLCPSYKVDPSGFPFAHVLRRIYDDPSIPDVWSSLWTVAGRRRVLAFLGEETGQDDEAPWDDASEAALRRLQRRLGLVVDGMWTSFVNRRVHDELTARGTNLDEVTGISNGAQRVESQQIL